LIQTVGQEKTKTEEILKGERLIRGEIEEFGRIRAELESKGLTMSIFIPIAKEFAGSKDFTREIAARLKETNSLTKAQKEIKAENDQLKASSTSLKSQVDGLSRKKDGLAADIVKLDKQLAGERESLAGLKQQREAKKQQYDLFEALLAMFSGKTPYQDCTPEKLASAVLKLAQGWYPGRPIEELRGTFVAAVCGDYLHSIQCEKCGARFIVDRAANSYNKYQDEYYCPVCDFRSFTKANDDFLKALFSQEELNRSNGLQQELERLKPMEVFLDIPCSVCRKPMSNSWTREQVLKTFTGWGHKLCLR
jgi:vacuolar-type H+-ATPase subunit I/STV1